MKGITWPGYEGEPRKFTSFPGAYAPGVILPLSELGLTEDEARRRLPEDLALVDIPADDPGDAPADTEAGES